MSDTKESSGMGLKIGLAVLVLCCCCCLLSSSSASASMAMKKKPDAAAEEFGIYNSDGTPVLTKTMIVLVGFLIANLIRVYYWK